MQCHTSDMRKFLTLTSACLLACSFTTWSATSTRDDSLYAQARSEFQRAYAAADANAADSEELQRYPLYPYLQATRLRRSLGELDVSNQQATPLDDAIVRFLESHGNEPVTRSLRRDWLVSLASRKQWVLFTENFHADSADTVLQCQAVAARIELKRTSNLEAAITPLWIVGKEAPGECDAAFDWLRSQNKLSADLIEQRARAALTSGNAALARRLAIDLPPIRRSAIEQWAALIQQPQAALDALINDPSATVEAAALLDGWTRLARQNPDAAIVRYDTLLRARDLKDNTASTYALVLALSLSYNRRPEALDYFARAQQGMANDERALEWYARAALWAREWERVDAVIDSMPESLKKQARWRYWAARAQEQLHQREHARTLYTGLLDEDNYYAVLAAARLSEQYAPHPQRLSFNEEHLERAAQQPAMVRAHELLLCNLRPLATTEWAYGYALLSPELQAQTVALASRWGWYEQAIATATRQSTFNDYEILYPRPYDRATRHAARTFSIPQEILYSVLRQESLYRSDAVSSAGAYGLLQLKPETARRMGQRIHKPLKSATDLFEPDTNITLGAAELRGLLDRFDGQLPVALAAYNAGPAAAMRWLPRDDVDADVWIENIPYNETRAYVQRVLWHNVVFTWLDTRESHKNLAWLTAIKRSEAG